MLPSVAEVTQPLDVKRLLVVLVMCRKAFSFSARLAKLWANDCADPQRQMNDLSSVNFRPCFSRPTSPLRPEFLRIALVTSTSGFTPFCSMVFLIAGANGRLCVACLALSFKSIRRASISIIGVWQKPLGALWAQPMPRAVDDFWGFRFHLIIITQLDEKK